MGLRINTVNNVYTYGTKRICALKILEDTLNGKSLKIYDEVPRPDRKSGTANILNENETLAAQEKQELLQTALDKAQTAGVSVEEMIELLKTIAGDG